MADKSISDNAVGNDFRVIAPRVFIKIYRLYKEFDKISEGRVFAPKSFKFLPRHEINSNAQGRIKGIEHETTALFGAVCQVNIADNLGGKFLNDVQEGDYIEVYYTDSKLKTTSTVQKVFDYSALSPLTSNDINDLNPQFTGHIWKVEEDQKPSQINLKIHAWDYHRLLQYINIPKGTQTTRFIYTKLMVDKINKRFTSRDLRGEVDLQNDFLDYVDNVIQTMLKSMSKDFDYGFVFRKPTVSYNLKDNKVSIKLVSPKVCLRGIGSAITQNSFIEEYGNDSLSSLITSCSFKQYKNSDIALLIDNEIAKLYSSPTDVDLSIFRFIDAIIKIDGENAPDSEGQPSDPAITFRVVADIVSVNQFYLAQLLVGGVTYEQGINEWYTPIIDISDTYKKKIEDLHLQFPFKTAYNNTYKMKNGLLTYAVFKVQILSSEVSRQHQRESANFTKIASFNLDSFSDIKNFFIRANDISLSAIADSIYGRKSSINITNLQYNPHLLSIAMSVVDFPQSKEIYEYVTQLDNLMVNVQQDNILRNLRRAFDLQGDNAFLVYYQMVNKFSVNIQRYSDLLMTAFRTDNHFVQYVSSVPGSYMRADIYTGSKFKTLGYDSVSIIRMVQIITSSMVGFPPTNNPKFAGGDVSATKQHFPMSIANRVLIESLTVMSSNNSNGVYNGYTKLDKLNEGDELFQFEIIKVGFRDTLSSSEEAEFNIPITHINDLGVVKGSAINKIFKFDVDLGDKGKFGNIKNALKASKARDDSVIISVIDSTGAQVSKIVDLLTEIPDSPLIITYKMGSDKQVSDMTASASEFEKLSLNDLMKSSIYDSLFHRERQLHNVELKSASQLPTSDPRLSGIINLVGNVVEQSSAILKPNIDKHYVFSPIIADANSDQYMSRSFVFDFKGVEADDKKNYELLRDFNNHLVSVTEYCDISDIIVELKNLRQMAINREVLNRDISNNANSKTLMENLLIRTPYLPIVVDEDVQTLADGITSKARKFTVKRLMVTNIEQALDTSEVTLYTYLETLYNQGIFDITQQDMVWTLPLGGHVVQRINTVNYTFDMVKTDFAAGGFHIDAVQARSYAAVIILDTLVKGMRYILWSLNKSRFVSHIYTPLDYSKYIANVNLADSGIIVPGSSIIISKPKEFSFDKQVHEFNSTITDSFDKVKGIFGDGRLFLDRLGKENVLEAFSDENGRYGMVWYVSKKIVYIGEDTGAMMRLLCTEGSFNWTVFYREDTQLTQVAEYFLKQGLGSFFLGGRK